MDMTTLTALAVGESGVVTALHATDAMRRRLLDIGLTENAVVTCLGRSPAGDPVAFHIRGAVIALRQKDCATIQIRHQAGGEAHGTH